MKCISGGFLRSGSVSWLERLAVGCCFDRGGAQVGLTQLEPATDINGDEAVANCYGVTYHYLPTKSGRDTRVFVGNYNFTLQKLGDSWKVSAMTFNAKFIDGNKELEKDAA